MFHEILSGYCWKPIRGCPGRYVLEDGIIPQSLADLFGLETRACRSERVPDPFEYARIDGGGLISYKKKNGWLHTLGDRNAFSRKLESLGIDAESDRSRTPKDGTEP